jgi:hypothetical protein
LQIEYSGSESDASDDFKPMSGDKNEAGSLSNDDDDDDDDDFKPVNPDKSSQPLQMLGIWACICVFT